MRKCYNVNIVPCKVSISKRIVTRKETYYGQQN